MTARQLTLDDRPTPTTCGHAWRSAGRILYCELAPGHDGPAHMLANRSAGTTI